MNVPTWLLLSLKCAKLLSVAFFIGGSSAAFIARNEDDKRRMAFYVVGPAFGATWLLGFLMLWAQSVPVLSGWILLSILFSFIALQCILWSSMKAERGGFFLGLFTFALLTSCIALMVFKPWPWTE